MRIKDRTPISMEPMIQSLSCHEMLRLIDRTESAAQIRDIARARFRINAEMVDGTDTAPFIRWTEMNRETMQGWVPRAVAKIAKLDLAPYLNGDQVVILAAPSSATDYIPYVKEGGMFQGALIPPALKIKQVREHGLNPIDAIAVPVPSYVHDRTPITNERNPQPVYLFDRTVYSGADVVILDDAIAQNETMKYLAWFLKTTLGAKRVFGYAAMSKEMEGGLTKLRKEAPYIDHAGALIRVTKTHGIGGPIEFH